VSSTATEALVLRSFDSGESDRIVHLLSPDFGRLSAIAKGAKRSVRRFAGTLDLFQRLSVQIARPRASALARLDQARLLDPALGLRADPRRFALACYLVELLDRLAPEGGARRDAARLFAFAADTLRVVAEREPDTRLRTLVVLRALDALGMKPELRACVRCGGELGAGPQVGFHVGEGGPLCEACGARPGGEGTLLVHKGTLRALEQSMRFDLRRVERLALGRGALAEAARLVGRFQRFHLGLELRSERFLDEILGGAEGRAA
jgi:DNA repair protein RecO (recombination protein O)